MNAPTAPPAPVLIGLSGYLKSGKDTAGEALVADGFHKFSPADAIRELLYGIDPSIVRHGVTYSLRELVDAYGWDEVKARFEKETRGIQQRCGETGRAMFGEHLFLDKVMSELPPGVDLLNTSVRFPDEAVPIVARGGYIIRVERPGYEPGPDAHISETAMDGYPFDFVITNAGTVADLHDEIRKIVATIRRLNAPPSTRR